MQTVAWLDAGYRQQRPTGDSSEGMENGMPSGTRILIVEDEEILAKNLGRYFLRRKALVKVVPSGEAALEAAGEFNPDMMILDYGLPGMDGLETFARLREIPLRCGCVLVTARPSDSVFAAARAAGIPIILPKPFSLSQLEHIVSGQLRRPADGTGAKHRKM
jgi:DNA-binding response OmpR family regulator